MPGTLQTNTDKTGGTNVAIAGARADIGERRVRSNGGFVKRRDDDANSPSPFAAIEEKSVQMKRSHSGKPLLLLPLVLLIVPIVEIALFILIGREIGIWWTLGMVLVTAVLGTILLRHQGFRLFERIRAEAQAGRVPGRELAHALLLLVAGLLLLTPGFFTDTLGFLLFVPPLRDAIWHGAKAKLFATIVPGMGGMAAGMGGMNAGADPFSQDSPGGFADAFGRSRDGVVDLDRDEYAVRPAPDAASEASPETEPRRH